MKRPWLFLFGAILLLSLPGNGRACGWSARMGPDVGAVNLCGGRVPGHLPHFAKYPPVYYSRPVARPYGYHPYAHWAQTHVPRVATPSPLVVVNQYAVGETECVSGRQVSPAPLKITNPFAQGPEELLPVPDASALSEPEA